MCSNVDIKLIVARIVNPFILCIYFFIHVALSHLMQDKFGDTALIAASELGHIECATVLLKHRADVNYQNKVRLLYECRCAIECGERDYVGTDSVL